MCLHSRDQSVDVVAIDRNVKVVMLSGLLAHQGVHAPPAVNPQADTGACCCATEHKNLVRWHGGHHAYVSHRPWMQPRRRSQLGDVAASDVGNDLVIAGIVVQDKPHPPGSPEQCGLDNSS